MEVAIVLLLLIGSALAGINNANNMANNYQFGTVAATSQIVNTGTVTANFRFGQVVTQDFVYTGAGGANAPAISAIVIEDLRRRKGATAAIVSGGVGATSVTIRFTSQRGFGINSRVTIYTG